MPSFEEQQQRPIRPVGPDGPLSWVVAVACSWNLLWSSLVRRSTGVIYVALVRTFGATREQTSWVLSVGTSLAWLIGPIIGAGTRHIPLMVLSFLGATITAVSAIGCAFAQDMTVIFFLLGVCSGIGNGIGMPTNDVTVAKYFRRYRGSGNGVYYAGGTLAAFAFPPIMNLLLQEYGFLGTFLITGGLMLNAIAACPFYRAPPWEKKRPNVARKKVSPEAADTSAVSAANRRESAASVKQPEQVATINGAYQAVMQADTISVGPHQEDDKKHLDKCSKPSLNSASILQNCEDFALYADGSSPDPNQTEDVTVVTESDGSAIERATKDSATATYEFPPPSSPKRGLSFSFLKRKHSSGAGDEPTYSRLDDNPNRQNAAANISGSINSAIPSAPKGSEHSLRHQAEIALYGSLDTIAVVADDDAGLRRQTSLSLSIAGRSSSHWAYLRSPVFYMVCLTCAVSVYNLLVLMILVDLAMEKGFTRRDGAVFLSVSAIGDASARLVAGVLSDRAFCDRRVLMGTSALLAGALCVALPHMHVEYYALAAVMCLVFGWSNGTVVVLFAPVLADQLGVESLGLSSGTCRFVMGVAYLACPKITGYFKDEVGSYDGLLYMVSIGAFFVGIMWTIDYVYRLLKSRTARSAR